MTGSLENPEISARAGAQMGYEEWTDVRINGITIGVVVFLVWARARFGEACVARVRGVYGRPGRVAADGGCGVDS